MISIDFDFLGSLAKEAGEAILDVYGTEFSVERKDDRSPLTLADKRSHQIIAQALLARYPDIPVLSEEGKEVPYSVRKAWSSFWLVDPLDGTKEFVKRNGEFTINIALIVDKAPLLGLIYIPVSGLLYMADSREGCWEIAPDGKRRALRVNQDPQGAGVRVVKSRSHPSPNLEAILELLPGYEVIGKGSALKFCTVAAGGADFYPRFGPTWEWDTAAGQAIVTAAGGTMLDFKGQPFLYNKPSLLNGPFLVASSQEWLKQVGILDRVASLNID